MQSPEEFKYIFAQVLAMWYNCFRFPIISEGGESMEIKWLGHSCFKLTHEGYSIIIDPFQPGRVPGYRDINETANEVLCTHAHFDHSWVDAVTLVPGGESPFSVRTVDTFHDPEQGALRGENTVYILSAGGVSAAHLGDVGCELTDAQIAQIGRVDAVMCPVGGYYTIDAKQARDLAERLNAGAVIPMHYRSERFGYDEIGTLDSFTSLFPAELVEYAHSDSITVKSGEKHRVVVPDYPE